MNDLVIRNASGILTGLKGLQERRTGDIRIRAGRIVSIGHVPEQAGDTVLDAKGGVITPGLVSTHHHLFQSMLKGIPTAINAPLENGCVWCPTHIGAIWMKTHCKRPPRLVWWSFFSPAAPQ